MGALRGSAPPGRAMTRCECAELSFPALARLAHEQGLSLDEVVRRTGCGDTCTACLPDLRAYLESNAEQPGPVDRGSVHPNRDRR